SRRRFVQGLAAGGVLAGLSTPAVKAFAQQGSATRGAAPVLTGTEFDLVSAESPVNFTGKPGVATTINGSLPAPTLRW
ncbi:twin-arginine translocation signal domain-containing protein, partial [Pseudomonas aeruginosa]|uniref:twin-arginine translocation signal domain-containing protein n=1 Tax=Pseudomonas aeruginosa TaxID=287 RepID=UPI0035263BF7